jgi:hypothetical protein
MLKRTPLMMAVLGLMTLVLTLSLLTGCKKDEPKKAEPAPDTASVLPEPPELEPIEDAFPEAGLDESGDPIKPAKTEPATKPAAAAKASKETKATASTTAKPASATASKPVAPAQSTTGIVKSGAYTLQIGIFNSEKLAKKHADALIAQGLPAYVTRVQDPKPEMPGLYYRVRVGSFATSTAAREYGATNLTPAGIDFWADLKGRDSEPAPAAKTTVAAPKPAPAPAPAAVATPPAATQTPAEPAKASTPGDSAPAPKLPDW